MNVLAMLDGASWTQCEDLDLKALESDKGLEVLLARLDKQWQYDERIELSTTFDTFFFKVQRRSGQTIMEYVTEFHQALREVKRVKISLPDEVTGWLMLRRAALTKEQQHLIQTQVGKSLNIANVEQALYLVFGQDFKQTHLPNPANKSKGFHKGKNRTPVMFIDDIIHDQDTAEWDDWETMEDIYWGDDATDEVYYDVDIETNPDGTVVWEDGYFETEESHADETLFDVQEFDEAYTAYVDAKPTHATSSSSSRFLPRGGAGRQSSDAIGTFRQRGKRGEERWQQGQEGSVQETHARGSSLYHGKGTKSQSQSLQRTIIMLAMWTTWTSHLRMPWWTSILVEPSGKKARYRPGPHGEHGVPAECQRRCGGGRVL